MSEVATNTPRLLNAAREFNIGKDTLIEFLESKGFKRDDLTPTAKLTEQMYRVLQSEFQQDKAAKEKAQKIELSKGAGVTEPKKKRDEEDLSIKKKETVAVVTPSVEKAVEAKPVEVVVPVVEIPKEEKPVEVKPVEKIPEPVAEITVIEKVVTETPKIELTRINVRLIKKKINKF